MTDPNAIQNGGQAKVTPPPVRAFEQSLAVISNDPVNGEYMRLVLSAPAELLKHCPRRAVLPPAVPADRWRKALSAAAR